MYGLGIAVSALMVVSSPLGVEGLTRSQVEGSITQSSMSDASSASCQPTQPDSLGPFYKPGAPVRSSVGEGYRLSGVVRSSTDCLAIGGARIEFWLAGPTGRYDDDHRGVVYSDESGVYQFESNPPPPYMGRPPHLHIRVEAAGHKSLVTQHYPTETRGSGTFDLVLVPTP
jgi:protocatechuate 3,4-dioxygenase beta subunit